MRNHLPESDRSEFDVGGEQQNRLFDALSHSHRRFIIQYLHTANTPLSVNEVAKVLIAWENPLATDQLSDSKCSLVEISLVHSHLPKMTKAGIIKYGKDRQMITVGDRTEEARMHLQAMKID